jgi:hypothetical protein
VQLKSPARRLQSGVLFAKCRKKCNEMGTRTRKIVFQKVSISSFNVPSGHREAIDEISSEREIVGWDWGEARGRD